jgi:hypothetical protein
MRIVHADDTPDPAARRAVAGARDEQMIRQGREGVIPAG